MEQVGTRLLSNNTIKVDSYKSDVLIDNESVNEVLGFFNDMSKNVKNIFLTNYEEYTDRYSQTFDNYYEYLDKINPEVEIDFASFDFKLNDMNFSVSLSLIEGLLNISYNKNIKIDFLPLLSEMEQRIILKKNEKVL